MITARTKRQLIIFVIITLAGVSFVGARYARLDRVLFNSSYNVTAHFPTSGGIFVGGEVTYRGVRVGQVTDMKLTGPGVDVVMAVDNKWKKIPADAIAVVANKSAVGEQYVDLEPKVDGAPYMKNGSTIDAADTRIPISTVEILQNSDNLVQSVPQDSLKTAVNELGQGFAGTGKSLSEIITNQSAFLRAANDNFATTSALIGDSATVLQTQIDKASAIRSFSADLLSFTDVLAGHDAALRHLVETGAATSTELRTFLEQNQVDLGRLISNLLVTNKAAYVNIEGIKVVLVAYPYIVAGGFTVLAKQGDGNYNARFGLVLQQSPPVCTQGYVTAARPPTDLSPAQLNPDSRCTEPNTQSDARGAQWAPRAAADYRAPVATYDDGKITWADDSGTSAATSSFDGVSPVPAGKDAISWLLLQPVTP